MKSSLSILDILFIKYPRVIWLGWDGVYAEDGLIQVPLLELLVQDQKTPRYRETFQFGYQARWGDKGLKH